MENYVALIFAVAFVATGSFVALNPLQFENSSDSSNQLKRFSSEQEFREYVSGSSSTGYVSMDMMGAQQDLTVTAEAGGSGAVKRGSDTNVQVEGVGEPDILKNDGRRIYYSPENYYRGGANTSVFQTLPAANFSEIDKLPVSGKMFLLNDTIISLGEKIVALDKQSHEKLWEKKLNSSIEAARRINDSLYFVLRKNVYENPCPIRPMESVAVKCTTFYHPQGEVDTTYTLLKVDADTGEVEERNGFVGNYDSQVYMSRDSVYLTYSSRKSETELMLKFLGEKGENYLPGSIMERIEQLRSFNLSQRSLQIEISKEIRDFFQDQENPRKARQSFENAFGNWTAKRKRKLTTTKIARFDTDLELEAEGEVPGELNDRFSMDEQGDRFRIATTVGDSWSFDVKPENDLYVLNDELEVMGSVKGMGLNERIYSARYIGDKAYVVTFRRIDPFHVIDLSNPEKPEVTGKLKLPGFSSYLHPLQEDRILGIGEENGSVKAVIFDVSGDDPEVLDSRKLDSHYSSISGSHHAFQIDRENKVFFLPGSENSYFFNYSSGIQELKEVELDNAKRSAYVNQNWYIFNDYNATVVEQGSWETVKQINYRNRTEPEIVPIPRTRIVQ